MIGILGAMQAEVDRLIGEIQDLERRTVCGQTFCCGKIGRSEVVVAKCGVGKVNAAICAQTMILTFHPEVARRRCRFLMPERPRQRSHWAGSHK